ncbi:peroxiredoxin-like family protein [Hugenholtzia roseola]|uniref:peroxiredoxin-like family protein n=1 Tax=Hugenholtzia roseola TaxID=1002 RepID=UPI0003FC2323|nr:peroxiredoxin-like family protein [Hugenholtzia roseola]
MLLDTQNFNFSQELAQEKQKMEQDLATLDKDEQATVRQTVEYAELTDIPKTALRKGATIPNFSLPNHEGKQVAIRDLYQKKPLVITFYRGQWCPFCSLQLRSLQQHLSQIENAPALLVAISAQTPDYTLSTKEKFNLGFEVLSDKNAEVAHLFGIRYKIPNYLYEVYKKFGIDLELYNGTTPDVVALPASATYIVDTKGKIIFDFVAIHDYDKLDPKIVVDFLKKQANF